MFAAHHRLGNLIALVDLNGQQALGYTRDVLDLAASSTRWRAFGWDVARGRRPRPRRRWAHALDEPGPRPARRRTCSSPDTTFGYGVLVHGVPRSSGTTGRIDDEQYRQAIAELEARRHEERLRSTSWSSSPTRDERVVLLTGDLGFTVARAVPASASPTASSTSASPSRTWSASRPGLAEAGLRPVRLLDRDLRDAAPVRVHPQRPGRCTTCRCASSASAAASTTATTASRTSRSRTSR